MTRMWISFANFGDPNMNLGGKASTTSSIPHTIIETNTC
jgi:hypothetical protein